MGIRQKTQRQKKLEKREERRCQRTEVGGEVIGEEDAVSLAAQNLERDAPRTDWDRMSQLR